ncbi:MAG TPA: arylsulfotransferase family protein [Solirubrobacteraceae bacterium]|nr:arylsulfotransferase family protein [Solirubrobacteraceae bacterium]
MDLTRGQFLQAACGGAAVALLPARTARAAATVPAETAGTPGYMSFHSRRDLHPPTVSVSGGAASGDEGYFFLGPTNNGGAQAGALIVDAAGQLVWFHPVPHGQWVSNFKVQQYANQPVLAWWEGVVDAASGYGRGSGVILDTSYRQVGRIHAGRGRHADLHELLLTPEGTALVTCYPQTVPADLSSLGGSRDGQVLESVIQEIDIRTGRVLLEWRSLDHIPLTESYLSPWGLWDYLHVNSIDLTSDGHLLISARNTWAVYKIHRRSGRVLWRLGGKQSDFAMAHGARFAWQHDARVQPGSRITLFDDGAGARKTESQSRGLVLALDHAHHRASLVQAYRHPRPLLAYAMGNMQLLDDGSVILGWGNWPGASEFAPDGSLQTDLRLPWGHATYRAFRLPWNGQPLDPPAVAAITAGSVSDLYASWNGATGVAAWQANAGPSPTALSPVGITPRAGFETPIALPTSSGYASVTALDSAGRGLGSSAALGL